MPQFYLAGDWAQSNLPKLLLPIDGDLAHHLRVRRIGADDVFTVFDGKGHTAVGRLSRANETPSQIEITQIQEDRQRELPYRIELIQGLASGDKMDWIIEKAVETGATSITPIECERSVVKLKNDPKRLEKRLLHWQAIAQAACEQCDRSVIPEVTSIQHPRDAFKPSKAGLKILLSTTSTASLHQFLNQHPPQSITLAIGPEGGFCKEEEEYAKQAGFTALSLGPRIVRTETAGIVAISAVESIWSLKTS
ncbi:16S rRNA (uracil(1498)-N(3))-methyltransferase [Polynucleobacter acidiphobus]|uniref:16S rRNA (uracil(1498)-N(3))-methyltransferase n=1 Tax=Polynucleobacter acidiphobus TaxID=556053 RepID=UPI000D3698D5|nr:16S rRNA (uracil(1498)-N(3))-methyltransferase [Polynucleobacter acidiphobus]